MVSAGEELPLDGTLPSISGGWLPSEPKRARNYWNAEHDDIVNYPKFEPLDYRVEVRAINAAKSGDAEGLHLVWAANVRLAFGVVNRFYIPHDLLSDCVQEGIVGIHRAIHKYEPERLLVFSTYAWNWVAQGVQRYLVKNRFGHRVPDHLYKDYCRFRQSLQRCLTRSDWFDHRERWIEADQSRYENFCRYHALVEAGPLPSDRHPVSFHASPDLIVEERDMVLAIRRAVQMLEDDHREIMILRYGLLGNREHTLEEIGALRGITRERVRQVQVKAEAKLCKLVRSHYPSLAAPADRIEDNDEEQTPPPNGEKDSVSR